MANILLVEDDPLVAATLRLLVELDPCHRVVAIADCLDQAVDAVSWHRIDLALVDLQLTWGSTGYMVADALGRRGIRCIFVSANVPPWPMPELAVGCIEKPFSADDVADALRVALDSPGTRTLAATVSAGFERY